jgi:thioredoxin-like negative regulator of GroEL
VNIIGSEQQFYKEINKESNSILIFISKTCPDSVRLNQFIEEIVDEYNQMDWFVIARDDFPSIAVQCGVCETPSLLIFRKGKKIVQLHNGYAKTSEQVRKFLGAYTTYY